MEEFNNGYFYVSNLRTFAREFGITVGNYRTLFLGIFQHKKHNSIPDQEASPHLFFLFPWNKLPPKSFSALTAVATISQ